MSPSIPICVLASGGLDSALLLQRALAQGYRVFPLYISCGLAWEEAEWSFLEKLVKEIDHSQLVKPKRLSFPSQEYFVNHWGYSQKNIPDRSSPPPSVFIPARNLTLLTMAGMYSYSEKLSEIWMGTLKGFAFPDRTPEFFREMEGILEKSLGQNFKIQTPFIEMEKVELIRQNPDFPFQWTLTCLNPKEMKPCRNCNKCEERRMNFEKAGIPDPLLEKEF